MKTNGIAHVGICVKNLEKSVDFYTKVMGFKVIDPPPAEFLDDPDEAKGLGFEKCANRVCSLEIAKNQIFELMEFSFPDSPADIPMPLNTLGKHHIAYYVDSMQEWLSKFRELGLEVVYKEQPFETGGETAYWALVKDPDGIVIEFIQTSVSE